jgi:2-polyprenyl-3-methyl-5-hydroxy-6-metoxy-1,4-benzoquinol methylase
MSNSLLQNSPFRGQAIDKDTNKVVDIYDFVGEFVVEDWAIVSIERSNMNTRVFSIADLNVVVQECNEDEGGVGAGVWLSSVAMLAWLSKNKDTIHGKTVLEMGCGVGLCSLGLSQMLISSPNSLITASDYKLALARAFESNVTLNNCNNISTFKLLNWSDCQKDDFTSCVYDVIIATDCIYKSTSSIFRTAVLKHLAPNGRLVFINPFERSRPGVDAFIYTLAELGEVNVQHINICMNGKYNTTLMFVEFTKHT